MKLVDFFPVSQLPTVSILYDWSKICLQNTFCFYEFPSLISIITFAISLFYLWFVYLLPLRCWYCFIIICTDRNLSVNTSCALLVWSYFYFIIPHAPFVILEFYLSFDHTLLFDFHFLFRDIIIILRLRATIYFFILPPNSFLIILISFLFLPMGSCLST